VKHIIGNGLLQEDTASAKINVATIPAGVGPVHIKSRRSDMAISGKLQGISNAVCWMHISEQ